MSDSYSSGFEPTHMPRGPIKPGEAAEAMFGPGGCIQEPPGDDKIPDWQPGPGRVLRTIAVMEPQTLLADRIVSIHMPAAIEHFIIRNAEYGDDDDFNLGSRGQYVDISRKVQKLKRRMWEGQPERDGEESTRTIVMELIGHLLMTMDYMEQEEGIKEDGGQPGL